MGEINIKSVKGQFILFIIIAILFVAASFLYIEFTGKETFTRIIMYFTMIIAVYNAGLFTQKYIHTKKK